MGTGKPKFYWDSAPLIAWIMDEKRQNPAEMSALAEVIQAVERKDAIMRLNSTRLMAQNKVATQGNFSR